MKSVCDNHLKCRRLEKQAVYYFYVVVCILLLAFLESVREMQKFAERDQNMKVRQIEIKEI